MRASGPAIVYGVGRTPLMLAAEARDLDELSGGRFILGLGNGTRRMISDWHGQDGERPRPGWRSWCRWSRQLWRLHEGPIDHEGRFYRVQDRPMGDLAAPGASDPDLHRRRQPADDRDRRPRRRRTARPHAVQRRVTSQRSCSRRWHRGAAHAGRDPADVTLATSRSPRSPTTTEQARREAPPMIAFYGSVKSYGALFEASAASAPRRRRSARRSRDATWTAMVDAVTDADDRRVRVRGHPAQVRDKLRRFDGLVDEVASVAAELPDLPERRG